MTRLDIDLSDDEAQPCSLAEWMERSRTNLQAMREDVHRKVDAMFDEQVKRLELDVHRLERDVLGLPNH